MEQIAFRRLSPGGGRELARLLPEDAIVSCDSGTITHWWARHMPVKSGQMHSISGNLGSMACAVPYAIAAQLAYPERTSVALVGDGGFTMLMGELATAVQYNLPVKVVVFKNNLLGAIRWEQESLYKIPEYQTALTRWITPPWPAPWGRPAQPVRPGPRRRSAGAGAGPSRSCGGGRRGGPG